MEGREGTTTAKEGLPYVISINATGSMAPPCPIRLARASTGRTVFWTRVDSQEGVVIVDPRLPSLRACAGIGTPHKSPGRLRTATNGGALRGLRGNSKHDQLVDNPVIQLQKSDRKTKNKNKKSTKPQREASPAPMGGETATATLAPRDLGPRRLGIPGAARSTGRTTGFGNRHHIKAPSAVSVPCPNVKRKFKHENCAYHEA